MAKKYCGNCGQLISKKKRICSDCDIEINEFKKPYNKMTLVMKIYLWILGIGTIGWVTQYTLFRIYNVPGSNYSLPLILIPFVTIYAIIQTRALLKSGFKRCKKCDKKSSLNSNYCIHCGDKIKWTLKL